MMNQPFGSGPGLPTGLTATQWTSGTGVASVNGSSVLTADGVRVNGDTTYEPTRS